MTQVEVFHLLGIVFPAIFGGGFLFSGYTSIMFLSEKEKNNMPFGIIWSSCTVGLAYIVETNRLSHFLYFRYALSDQVTSFELWYILMPTAIFFLNRLMQNSGLKHISIETFVIILILNIAYFVGIFSVVIALTVSNLIF